MEKVKLKHVVIKNLGVVRDVGIAAPVKIYSRGSWVKVQIGRLGVTETDNLTNIITKTVSYNSFKNIGGTIECVVWVRCDKSFVSAGDIFYGDVEFSVEDGSTQAIELDSFTTDVTATYSWEFPDDEETTGNTFTLLQVAIKIRESFIHWLRRYKKKLNAAPREKYVTPQLEILEDRVTEKPKKSSAKKKTASKKGGKR